jgi:hypothetical protein
MIFEIQTKIIREEKDREYAEEINRREKQRSKRVKIMQENNGRTLNIQGTWSY